MDDCGRIPWISGLIIVINILLTGEGMGDYHFYSAEASDIRRGRRPSWIPIGGAE